MSSFDKKKNSHSNSSLILKVRLTSIVSSYLKLCDKKGPDPDNACPL